MDKEINKIVMSYPPATMNNARSIVRSEINRMMNMKNKKMGMILLEANHGLDCDHITGFDDGEAHDTSEYREQLKEIPESGSNENY